MIRQCMFFLGVLGTISSTVSAQESSPRLWKSADGRTSVSASLVAVRDNEVVLKRADNGKEVVVPRERLCTEDIEFVKQQIESHTEPKGEKLELINKQSALFRPFGPIPAVANSTGWIQISHDPPTIWTRSTAILPVATQTETVVEILSAMDQEHLFEVAKDRVGKLKNSLSQRYSTLIFEFTESEDFKEYFEQNTLSLQTSAVGREKSVAICLHFLLIPDKTVLVQSTISTSGNRLPAVLDRVNQEIVQAIRANSDWYPPQSIPPDVRQGVEKFISQLQESLRDKNYDEFFELAVSPSELAAMKTNRKQFQNTKKVFAQHKAAELTVVLTKADLATATYEPEAQQMTIPATPKPLVFTRRDGRWSLEN